MMVVAAAIVAIVVKVAAVTAVVVVAVIEVVAVVIVVVGVVIVVVLMARPVVHVAVVVMVARTIVVIERPWVVEVATVILIPIAVVKASTTTSLVGSAIVIAVVVRVMVVVPLSRWVSICNRSSLGERSNRLAFSGRLGTSFCVVALGPGSSFFGGRGDRGHELCALVALVLLGIRVGRGISCRSSRGLGISLHSGRVGLARLCTLMSGSVSFDILIGGGLLLVGLDSSLWVSRLAHLCVGSLRGFSLCRH